VYLDKKEVSFSAQYPYGLKMFSRWFVNLSNLLTRLRRIKVPPENLLLLVPRCLQKNGCDRTLGETIDDCKACGQCNVTDLLAIRDEFGIHCSLAGGGREALAFVRNPQIKAVVAVACEKELSQGILAVFPTPVLGVLNIQTNGPCRNTHLDPDLVRTAVRAMLK
jgi:uncharacterized protein